MNGVIMHGFSGFIHGSPRVMYSVRTNNHHLVASESDGIFIPPSLFDEVWIRGVRLAAVGNLKRYSKVLEYKYRVKTVTLGTLKRYFIFSLTLYLE
jgi:hypothetical protein